MSGVAAFGRRARAGIAGWLTALTGDPALWDDEDARAPDGAYWGLIDLGSTTGWSYRDILAPLVQVDLQLTPEYGTAHTYTLGVGSTPLEYTLAADTVAADLPGILAASWALSGFGLDGWTLAPLTDELYRLSAPAAAGGLPALVAGWGMDLVDHVYGEDRELEVHACGYRASLVFWDTVRSRGRALAKCAAVARAQGAEYWIHQLRKRTGAMLGSVSPARYDGSMPAGPGAAGHVPSASCDIELTLMSIEALPVETVGGVETFVHIVPDEVP